MNREQKEMQIRKIFVEALKGADRAIFMHALSTYGYSGSLAEQVCDLNPDEFAIFYDDCMVNWGDVL